MLTKVYQRDDDYRFTDQLHQAAIYSPDRSVLYDLVHSAKVQKFSPLSASESKQETTAHEVYVAPDVEPAIFIENEIEITVSPQEEIIAEDDDVASILLDKKPEIIAPLTDEPAEHPAVSEVTIPLIVDEDEISPETEPAPAVTAEESQPEIQEAAVTASDLGPLEREILLEAISSSIELEVSEGVGEYTEDAKTDNAVAVEESPVKAETQESLEDSEPLSMAEYLARRAKQIHFGEASEGQTTEITRSDLPSEEETQSPEQVEERPEKNNFTDEELPWEDNTTTLSHGHKRISISGEREHQQSLIDKFIKAEPRITPGKAAEYNLQTAARESLEEDFEFVTETMARLFAQQGKPDKARKAFKKLMEQHPEKSVYFAAQLKNLDRIKKP